jgi:malate dehydrogenase (quinone)
MKYSEDRNLIGQWVPLVMEGRKNEEPVAATKMDLGTDVNFGMLTKNLLEGLGSMENVNTHFKHTVTRLKKKNNKWHVTVVNEENNTHHVVCAPFVFIGAGGGSLPLLLKSKIPESKGFGGFPVSGQWLRCTNKEVIKQHAAKVYGAAAVGSPPMSVPHLDTRWIKGKRELLFGPYAGFTTKFLKNGSLLDLFRSIKFSNIKAMIFAGVHNLPLTKYLIDQVRLTPDTRLDALREYYPNARKEDWELAVAGYRVQVIKKDEEEGGILEFGTEVVSAADGSIAALLGASPGASTAVSIMIDLVHKCFSDQVNSAEWQNKLRKLIPSYGKPLNKDAALTQQIRAYTSKVLRLHKLP